MNLASFIETYQDAITRAVLRTYPPVYTARNRDEWGFDLCQLRRRPLGAQGDAIRAVAVSLRRHRGTNLVGEMGTGKTTIGAAAAYLAGFTSVLVLCPPHLVRKWQREVVATVPFARTAIVSRISHLDRLRLSEVTPLFVITLSEQNRSGRHPISGIFATVISRRRPPCDREEDFSLPNVKVLSIC